MDEYIKREAAKRTIVEAVDNGLATTSADLAEILDELPTANVVPAGETTTLRAEIERLKAENKRLHEENFWLTGHTGHTGEMIKTARPG